MKNIDFLPPEMLRQNEVRSLRWWWIGVCIAFAFFIATAAALQWMRLHEVKRELARIEPLCEEARTHEKSIAQLGQQLSSESDVANLLAFLGHPWPRSRILADLIAALPPELQTTEIKLTEQPLTNAKSSAVAPTQVLSADQKPTLPPAIEDFRMLWKRSSDLQTVAEVKGVTQVLVPLHKYVSDLSNSPLIESAKIESLEEVTDRGKSEMRFTVRVVIFPAFSFPGGPTQKNGSKAPDALARAGAAP